MKSLISFLLRNVPRKYLQLGSHFFLRVYAVFLRGHGSYCPVCESEFKKFLPYGRIEPRDNALCPKCLSLERHRLIWVFLKQKTEFFEGGQKMLHIAPELCFLKKFEELMGENYVTGDIESPLAKVKMDIHEIPFEDNQFDVVFCNHVLEHVDNDLKAISEIARVLKPGGWAILQVPFFPPLPEITEEDITISDPKEREERFGQDDHVRKYGLDYPERIRSQGLVVNEIDLTAELPEETVSHYGLPKGEIIFQAVKPT